MLKIKKIYERHPTEPVQPTIKTASKKKKLKSGSGQSSDDESGLNDIDSTTQGEKQFEDVIYNSDEESKMDQSTITLANILEKTKDL